MESVILPDHVPEALVRDFNIYAPPGIDADFHQAWATLLQESDDCPRTVVRFLQ